MLKPKNTPHLRSIFYKETLLSKRLSYFYRSFNKFTEFPLIFSAKWYNISINILFVTFVIMAPFQNTLGASPDASKTRLKSSPSRIESLKDGIKASTAIALAGLVMNMAHADDTKFSGYEPLAANGTTTLMVKNKSEDLTKTLESKGFSRESIQSIRALSDFVREKEVSGGLAPTESVSIITIDPLSTDGKGLENLVNTGSKLEKKSFEQVTKESTLTQANYAKAIEALFDSSDIDTWLTRADGSEMSEKEKSDYRESLAAAKVRWSAKLPELLLAGKQEVVAKWFDFSNALIKNPIHGSREEFRRGIIASLSMASFVSMTPEQKKKFAATTITQAAEYILMTDPKAQMIKIERSFKEEGKKEFTLKYLVPSDDSMKKTGFEEGIQAANFAFQSWNEDQAKKFASYKEINGLKNETAAIKNDIAKIDNNIATIKNETATIKNETAILAEKNKTLGAYNELSKNFNILSEAIMKQLDEIGNKRGDRAFIESLNKNISDFKALK